MEEIRLSRESLLSISYILLVLLFLLSMIILIFFTEFVYVPLRRITDATEQYAAGNMHYEFTVDSDDEIGYLAAALQYMAREISKAEDNQKKFVANVSHDFRSPLTSIKGYLEAMLDGTIPTDMHEKYLGIVLNETDRLTKLTNSLLTLNNLNVRGVALERGIFDINKVIRNTAASSEVQLREKRISIQLVLTGDKMLVEADMVKIQQVMYNLLDNAIKFSHNDGSIKIETNVKHSKMFVSVKDNGIGIPKDSLKLIWDRFYKTDLSRGKDKKGTGLGLSIAKEIISTHNEHINVISTEGVGTEFIFSLPMVDSGEDEYYVFSAKCKRDGKKEVIQCGLGTARDFLELIDHKGLPLFNSLLGDSNVNNRQEHDNRGSENSKTKKWNETAKQLYNAIMWLIILWDAKPDTPLFDFKDEVCKYKNW